VTLEPSLGEWRQKRCWELLGMGVVIHSHSDIQKGLAFIQSFDGPKMLKRL